MEKKHILVVDDDPSLRLLFQAVLENYGYTSQSTDNGGEALRKLAQETYDAVLLDYSLPDMTGLTILRHLQQVDQSIPVVILTGHTDEMVAEKAMAAGARACLYKPFDCCEIEKVLNDLLGTPPLKTVISEHLAIS